MKRSNILLLALAASMTLPMRIQAVTPPSKTEAFIEKMEKKETEREKEAREKKEREKAIKIQDLRRAQKAIQKLPEYESLMGQFSGNIQEMAKGRLFTGRAERLIKERFFQTSIFELITPEEQEPLEEYAEALGQEFVAEYEVIVDLTNKNIDTLLQADLIIRNERKKIRGQVDDLKQQLDELDLQIQQKSSTTMRSDEEMEEDASVIKELKNQRDELNENYDDLREFLAIVEKNENLTVFKLGRNYLQEVPADAFEKYPKLKALNLSDNKISRIDPSAFHGLPKLTALDLSGNKFSHLPLSAIIGAKKLAVLNVEQTPLGNRMLLPTGEYAKYNKALPNTIIFYDPLKLTPQKLIALTKLTALSLAVLVAYSGGVVGTVTSFVMKHTGATSTLGAAIIILDLYADVRREMLIDQEKKEKAKAKTETRKYADYDFNY